MLVLDEEAVRWVSGGYDSNEIVVVGDPNTDWEWNDWWSNNYDPEQPENYWPEYEPGAGGGGGAGGAGENGDQSIKIDVDLLGALIDVLKNTDWTALGINANEWRLSLLGGYDSITINTNNMMELTQYGDNVHVFWDTQNQRMYADRDGDGVIDTGVLYNNDLGTVSFDYNCDGIGDAVVYTR